MCVARLNERKSFRESRQHSSKRLLLIANEQSQLWSIFWNSWRKKSQPLTAFWARSTWTMFVKSGMRFEKVYEFDPKTWKYPKTKTLTSNKQTYCQYWELYTVLRIFGINFIITYVQNHPCNYNNMKKYIGTFNNMYFVF